MNAWADGSTGTTSYDSCTRQVLYMLAFFVISTYVLIITTAYGNGFEATKHVKQRIEEALEGIPKRHISPQGVSRCQTSQSACLEPLLGVSIHPM